MIQKILEELLGDTTTYNLEKVKLFSAGILLPQQLKNLEETPVFKTSKRIPLLINSKLEGLDRIREAVRIRDKQTCQDCGKIWEKGMRKFDVHHLDPERESTNSYSWDKQNMHRLITFCHKCHMSKHARHIKNRF